MATGIISQCQKNNGRSVPTLMLQVYGAVNEGGGDHLHPPPCHLTACVLSLSPHGGKKGQ